MKDELVLRISSQDSALNLCVVFELKTLCEIFSVSKSGLKADLVSRLSALDLTPISIILTKL